MKQQADNWKPCNKIVTNYCYNITQTYQGYLTGKDITYTSDKDISNIQDILNYNDCPTMDSELLKQALIYGVGYEIMYIDQEKKPRFRTVDSREIIPVFWNDLEQELAFCIRLHRRNMWDNTIKYYVDVYYASEIVFYETDELFSNLKLLDMEPNFFGQVPINILYLNPEEKSIFDQVMGLQDAYNNLISSEVDDFQAFCDCYLVLKNLTADEEEIQMMKENRVLEVGEDGEVYYLNKNISDTQIENMLKNVNDTIHKIANCPDFSQESFGTSSGIALRYRLLGFENRAGNIEKTMIKTLQRRIELICAILKLKGEEVWRDIQIIFTRNLPTDINETVNVINSLRGLVSDKTLLAQIPFIQDIDTELEMVQEQKKLNQSLYSFGGQDGVLDQEG